MRVIEQRKAFDLWNYREGERTWPSNIQVLKSGARCAVGQRLRPARVQQLKLHRCKFRNSVALGKRAGKCRLLLKPKQIGRDEPVDIGVHGEMAGRAAAEDERQCGCKRDHGPYVAGAQPTMKAGLDLGIACSLGSAFVIRSRLRPPPPRSCS